MTAPRINIKKQSLIDWQVTDAVGTHVAWIRRPADRIGYNVYLRTGTRAPDREEFATSFEHAKTIVRNWLAPDTAFWTDEMAAKAQHLANELVTLPEAALPVDKKFPVPETMSVNFCWPFPDGVWYTMRFEDAKQLDNLHRLEGGRGNPTHEQKLALIKKHGWLTKKERFVHVASP